MTQLDFESDTFLQLLTEALRAGPGSPEWHEALASLRSGGIEYPDEYRLLVTAREHLESGRQYRSVRAGPAFTEELMGQLDADGRSAGHDGRRSTVIAAASAAAILAVVAAIAYFIATSPKQMSDDTPGTTLLVNPVTVAGFSGELPADWRRIGALGVEFVHSAMKPVTGGGTAGAGGGVTWSNPINASEPFALVANIRVQRVEPDLITQVFVTDTPEFDPDNATAPHELVWLLQANHAQVILPDGQVQARSEMTDGLPGGLLVKIVIDGVQATVESRGAVVWSGSHELDPTRPRYVGVRFLRASEQAGDGVAFGSVRVNMRPK